MVPMFLATFKNMFVEFVRTFATFGLTDMVVCPTPKFLPSLARIYCLLTHIADQVIQYIFRVAGDV